MQRSKRRYGRSIPKRIEQPNQDGYCFISGVTESGNRFGAVLMRARGRVDIYEGEEFESTFTPGECNLIAKRKNWPAVFRYYLDPTITADQLLGQLRA